MQPYATSLDHLLAEVDRTSLLLHLRTQKAGEGGAPEGPSDPELRVALEAAEREIASRRAASLEAGVSLRLVALARTFGLTVFDVEAILFALLPEIDVDVERTYAEIQGSPSRRWPTVALILGLLCPSLEAQIAARSRFLSDAPLVRHALVHLVADAADAAPSLPGHLVKIDPRIASHLLGADDLDPFLRSCARLVVPSAELADLPLPEVLRERLSRFVARRGGDAGDPIVYLQGLYGTGKRSTAEALSKAIGAQLLVVDGASLTTSPDDARWAILQRAGREASLRGAAIYWSDADALLDQERPAARSAFISALEAHQGLTFLAGERRWEPAGEIARRAFIRVEMPRQSAADQERSWGAALSADPGLSADVDLGALTGAFRLTGGQIRDAAATARNLARFRAPSEPVSQVDLTTAARLHANSKLTTMGRWITARTAWEDLVLPREQRERLEEICSHVRYRGRVMDGWGFDRKLALGKGISALFSGPPGTGKTLAAGALAKELGLDLYHVDLSAILSKYIGETEKHLSQLFDEAEASSALLFFDEADTLFGKRTEVKDAHDRNANLEASYMLQRIEAYDGMAILASNFTKNIDEAFMRRMRFIIEFPFPGEAERRRIWERIFPAETPLGTDLDLGFMARQIELAGGHIRNIALRAAFIAASDGGVVCMRHLLCATRWEYQKMGKIVDASRFAHPASAARQAIAIAGNGALRIQ